MPEVLLPGLAPLDVVGSSEGSDVGASASKRRGTLLSRALPLKKSRERAATNAAATGETKADGPAGSPSSMTASALSELQEGATWNAEWVLQEEYADEMPAAPKVGETAAARLLESIRALDAVSMGSSTTMVSVRDLQGLIVFLDSESDDAWPRAVRVLAYDAVIKAIGILGASSADPIEGYPYDDHLDAVVSAVKSDIGATSPGDIAVAATRCFAQLPPRIVWKMLEDAKFASELGQMIAEHPSAVARRGITAMLPYLLLRCWMRAQSPVCPESDQDVEDRIADIYAALVLQYASPDDSIADAAFLALHMVLEPYNFRATDDNGAAWSISPHEPHENSATRKLIQRLHRKLVPRAEGLIARARHFAVRSSPMASRACAALRAFASAYLKPSIGAFHPTLFPRTIAVDTAPGSAASRSVDVVVESLAKKIAALPGAPAPKAALVASILSAAEKSPEELASLWGSAIEKGDLSRVLKSFASAWADGPSANVSLRALSRSITSLLVALLVRHDATPSHAVEALAATADCLSWDVREPALVYAELLLRARSEGADIKTTISEIVEWRLGSIPDPSARLRLQWAVAHAWEGDENDPIGGAIVDALRVELLLVVRARSDDPRPPTMDDFHRLCAALDCLEYLGRRCPSRVLAALTECAKAGGLPSLVRMHARRVYARVFSGVRSSGKSWLPEISAASFSDKERIVWTSGLARAVEVAASISSRAKPTDENTAGFVFVDEHRCLEGEWKTIGALFDPILVSARMAFSARRSLVAVHVVLFNQSSKPIRDLRVHVGARGTPLAREQEWFNWHTRAPIESGEKQEKAFFFPLDSSTCAVGRVVFFVDVVYINQNTIDPSVTLWDHMQGKAPPPPEKGETPETFGDAVCSYPPFYLASSAFLMASLLPPPRAASNAAKRAAELARARKPRPGGYVSAAAFSAHWRSLRHRFTAKAFATHAGPVIGEEGKRLNAIPGRPNVELALDSGSARLSRVAYPSSLLGSDSLFAAFAGRIFPGDVSLAYTCEGAFVDGKWELEFEFRSSAALKWRDPDASGPDEDDDFEDENAMDDFADRVEEGTFRQWFADITGSKRLRLDGEYIPFIIGETLPFIELAS